MNKKKLIIGGTAAGVILVAAIFGFVFLKGHSSGSSDSGDLVYVDSVTSIMGLGSGTGQLNRFAGVVEPQKTVTIKQSSDKKVKECYVKEYINPSCFGHLTINFNGEVCCLNERIESLRDMDLPYIINKWVGSQGCLWYLARNKRCCCKECAIQVLCPSVSIYELLNIYKCPCTV